jgi:hypothetical protein
MAQRRRRDHPDRKRSTVSEASPISIGVERQLTGRRGRPHRRRYWDFATLNPEETSMSARRRDGEPGPEEARELAIEDDIAARDEVLEGIDAADDDDDGDGDETPAEMLELDQTELDELGLTLDDPHQPVDE